MSPTTAFPVFTPILTPTGGSPRATLSRFHAFTFSTSLAAAETALRAWSGWTIGAPKKAMTASPMNLSSVPPSAKIASAAKVKKVDRNRDSESGSIPSAALVNPTMSAKKTVTFRVLTRSMTPLASEAISSTTPGEW